MAFDTASTIINDAAVELKLIPFQGIISDPFNSTNENIGLLCQLLKSCGNEIISDHQWTQSIKEHTFVTIQDVSTYPLPVDFLRILDNSEWNRTTQLSVDPVSPQWWQFLKARLAGATFFILFRKHQGQIRLYPDVGVPGGYTIAFEYMSNYWVQPSGESSGTTSTPTASNDTILFPGHMMTKCLKYAWLKANDFNYADAYSDFQKSLEQAINADLVAPILNMGRSQDEILYGYPNVPITGFGV